MDFKASSGEVRFDKVWLGNLDLAGYAKVRWDEVRCGF